MIDLTVLIEFDPGAQSLADVQSEYHDKILGYMEDYLQSDRPITSYKNEYKRAINDGFTAAFAAGWYDAGATGALTDEAISWLNGRIEEELGYLDSLFTQLRALRADETLELEDKLAAAADHAEGYTGTLTGVYEHGFMMAEPHRDGRWEVGDTEHCDTCAGLDGQVHPMSWYLDHGFIPQESGSSTLDCGGYNCRCRIVNPKTGEQLLP